MTPQEQLRKFRESQQKQLSPQEQLKQFRASQSRGSSLGMARPKSFEELSASSTGKDLGNFDYTTGAKAVFVRLFPLWKRHRKRKPTASKGW